MTPDQIKAIRMIADAIIDAVKAAGPLGAPGGIIYAALMAHGCTLDQFNTLMSVLTQAGKLRRSGDLWHAA